MREVKPAYGHIASVGYTYRIRVRSQEYRTWLGLGPKDIRWYWVRDRKFMSVWEWDRWSMKYFYGPNAKQDCIDHANQHLDDLEKGPKGEFV